MFKVMESIGGDVIVCHMVNNGSFADEQHGFYLYEDILNTTFVSLECWCDILDNSGLVDIIYIDFAKAFDTVPHE